MRKPNFQFNKEVVIFFVFAAVLVLEVFIILPWSVKHIVSLNQNINKIKRELHNIEEDWPNKEKYAAEKESLEQDIENLFNKFLAPQEESKIFSFISSQAKDFNVELESISPGELLEYKTIRIGEFKYLPIKVEAKANFHSLALLLNRLKNAKYYFEVKDLKIESQKPLNSVNMIICAVVREE